MEKKCQQFLIDDFVAHGFKVVSNVIANSFSSITNGQKPSVIDEFLVENDLRQQFVIDKFVAHGFKVVGNVIADGFSSITDNRIVFHLKSQITRA